MVVYSKTVCGSFFLLVLHVFNGHFSKGHRVIEIVLALHDITLHWILVASNSRPILSKMYRKKKRERYLLKAGKRSKFLEFC